MWDTVDVIVTVFDNYCCDCDTLSLRYIMNSQMNSHFHILPYWVLFSEILLVDLLFWQLDNVIQVMSKWIYAAMGNWIILTNITDIGVGAWENRGIDPPSFKFGWDNPQHFSGKTAWKKIRNMAAIELQTQLEYNAIVLSVNDFVTGSSNRKKIFGWASSWYQNTLNCHRMSTFLKTIRRCIERGITLARAAELFRPTVLSLFWFLQQKSVIILYASSWKVTNFMACNSYFKTNEQLPDLLSTVHYFTVSVVYTVRVQN